MILSLGRITKMKGFQEVIKIMPGLLREGIKVRYIIAGKDDGYQKILIQLAQRLGVESQVELIGFLDLEEKKHYLDQTDMVAIPSLGEPFGLVAVEAMFFDKVILTTDLGGWKEVLKGYPKKVNIYDKILWDQIQTKKEQKSAFDRERFDWWSISKEYEKILKEIAPERKRWKN